MLSRQVTPPFKPSVSTQTDVKYFDREFIDLPAINSLEYSGAPVADVGRLSTLCCCYNVSATGTPFRWFYVSAVQSPSIEPEWLSSSSIASCDSQYLYLVLIIIQHYRASTVTATIVVDVVEVITIVIIEYLSAGLSVSFIFTSCTTVRRSFIIIIK